MTYRMACDDCGRDFLSDGELVCQLCVAKAWRALACIVIGCLVACASAYLYFSDILK